MKNEWIMRLYTAARKQYIRIYSYFSFQGRKKKKVSLIEDQKRVRYFQRTKDDQNTWIPVFVTKKPEDQLGQKEFKHFLEKQEEIGFTDFPVPFDEIVTRRGREQKGLQN